ncbi:MAG: LPS export ABC transporter periplasmic protein LptC [Gemmatimonadales bacterium]
MWTGTHASVRRICLTLLLDGFAGVALWGCNDGIRPTATQTVADSADQVLFGMSHVVTADGVPRSRVRADTAYFFSATQSAELRTVHVTFYDARGVESSTLTAREGTYRWRTGDMEGRGSVVVIRKSDGGRLTTEVLRYSQTPNEVTSDRAFVFNAPSQHIEGEGFTSDPEFRNLVAKRPHGTGGQLTLPNR